MMRNMAMSLFTHRKIETTHVRALELKKFAERLVTVAKRGDLTAKRFIFSQIGCNDVSCQLFDLAKAQYINRSGGYTKITKYRFRKGDGAHMVLLELV
jgi:large subunit ribosomal protein L17